MKRILLLATVLCMAMGCTSKNHYTVKGNLTGVEGKVYLLDSENKAIDSTTVENGAFCFEGNVEIPEICVVSTTEGTDDVVASLFLEPGNIVIAEAEENEAMHRGATGTPSNDANIALRKASKALIDEYRTADEARREEIAEQHYNLMKGAYENNRDNLFGLYILAQAGSYEMDGQEILDELAKFAPEVQQTRVATELRERAEQRLRTDIGQPYINIEQPNAKGESVSLKSVVENPANKYVLLDFWASWCGPCMGEVPGLVEAYKKYHAKGLEIYGVSFDSKEENWTAAIKEKGMAWVNVSLLSSFDNDAAKEYSVQAIPTNFLIDCSTGKIIAKNLRGEDVAKKFAELFK